MFYLGKKVKEIIGCKYDSIAQDILTSAEPIILRGLVHSWPLVEAGLASDEDACAYLKQFYAGNLVTAYFGSPENNGRYFYNENLSGLNFEKRRVTLDAVLDEIFIHKDSIAPPSFYVGSASVGVCFPKFRDKNDVTIPYSDALVSIWLGNESRIACHYDAQDNIACVAVGKRRFTLFPPEQVANLYPGPIDFTPAGQAISLVDFSNPDFDLYPRFRVALDNAFVAELDAGDALFLPSMWWHYVEGLSKFNVLVNYWWKTSPVYCGPAIDVLKHAMLSVRDLPEKEKLALRCFFDYYIFGDSSAVTEHIPINAQGCLAPINDMAARQLRAWIANSLNR